jgi:hypothetical protein
MMLHTQRLYSARTGIVARMVCVTFTYTMALLVHPTVCIVLGLVCLVWYGGYEVIGAALLLDALLAPGGGMFGEYHYTVFFLIAGALATWARRALFTAQE